MTDDNNEVTTKQQAAYSKYAKCYDLAVKALPVWKTWISAVIPHIRGPKVLEVSFGTGYLLMQYAHKYEEVYGVDCNETMVEKAQTNLGLTHQNKQEQERNEQQDDKDSSSSSKRSVTLQKANVENLPFADGTFDTIVNTMAFSGYTDGDKAMTELKRVLKPGGRIVLVDFVYPANGNYLGTKLSALMEYFGDTIRDMDALFHEHGLFISQREEVGGFGSVCLYVAEKSYN